MDVDKFEQWAVVELFGHQMIAGKVSEQTIAGQGFIRVDVPEVGSRPGYTRFFGHGAIYSIVPAEEEAVKRVIVRIDARPIAPYLLASPAPIPLRGDPTDEEDPDEDDSDFEEPHPKF